MSDGKRCRVLVVEDEPIVALSLERMLEAEGCVVVGPAGSVAAALSLLESSYVDGAFLDVSLRNEQVFPVADRLVESNTPFFFVTGHGTDVFPPTHRNAAVMTKPYSEEEVLRAVKTFVKEIV